MDKIPARLRVALIGYGASGALVGELLRAGAGGPVDVTGVLVRDPARHAADAAATGWRFTVDLGALLGTRPHLVAELAGHDALRAYGEEVLRAGVDLLTLSVGALADDALRARLVAAAEAGDARILVPSGAIAGLDAIGAAALLGLDRVEHRVRKPPRALLDGAAADEVTAGGVPVELYAGPAREAAVRFPANVNVVAAVSLAGLGVDATEAAVVADPGITRNTHEVTAEGDFGRLSLRLENRPSPANPKTGVLTAASVVRAIRRRTERLVIGA